MRMSTLLALPGDVDFDPITTSPLRFAIGDPAGLTSNSWKVWVHGEDDVYLACRDNYKELKVSLHASGRWRMGFTQEAVGTVRERNLLGPDEDRAWSVWDQPPEVIPASTAAFRLFFFPQHLAVTPGHRTSRLWRREQIYVRAPQPPAITIVTLWVTQGAHVLRAEDHRSLTLARLPLGGAKMVQVTVSEETPSAAFLAGLEGSLAEARAHTQAAGVTVPEEGRVALFGNDNTGCRFMVEANYHD